MIYTVIRQLQKEALPVQKSCDLLAVSRSGFYTAQHRTAKPASCKASIHLKAAFMASHQSYGSRRLVTAMANAGVRIAPSVKIVVASNNWSSNLPWGDGFYDDEIHQREERARAQPNERAA